MKKLNLTGDVRFIGAGVAEGPAAQIGGAPTNAMGEQCAVGVTNAQVNGTPLIFVTFVLGERQFTATLDAAQADKFCHLLADQVLWQNDQLRQKSGQAVH